MHDYAYYDALAVSYEPVEAYDYDKRSMSAYEYQVTLEVIEFLESHYVKADPQAAFGQFLDLAL